MKNQFLSTPSARRATQLHALGAEVVVISIHALREEGDSKNSSPSPGTANFYPRPPRGGRRTASRCFRSLQYFYPRPPRGGRPAISVPPYTSTVFLSTPSARRATATAKRKHHDETHFYPRPPRGGRPNPERRGYPTIYISIHALREEGDSQWASTSSKTGDFYPRPPRGGRRQRRHERGHQAVFLSTPSARRATRMLLNSALTSLFLSTPSARRATRMT